MKSCLKRHGDGSGVRTLTDRLQKPVYYLVKVGEHKNRPLVLKGYSMHGLPKWESLYLKAMLKFLVDFDNSCT